MARWLEGAVVLGSVGLVTAAVLVLGVPTRVAISRDPSTSARTITPENIRTSRAGGAMLDHADPWTGKERITDARAARHAETAPKRPLDHDDAWAPSTKYVAPAAEDDSWQPVAARGLDDGDPWNPDTRL